MRPQLMEWRLPELANKTMSHPCLGVSLLKPPTGERQRADKGFDVQHKNSLLSFNGKFLFCVGECDGYFLFLCFLH